MTEFAAPAPVNVWFGFLDCAARRRSRCDYARDRSW